MNARLPWARIAVIGTTAVAVLLGWWSSMVVFEDKRFFVAIVLGALPPLVTSVLTAKRNVAPWVRLAFVVTGLSAVLLFVTWSVVTASFLEAISGLSKLKKLSPPVTSKDHYPWILAVLSFVVMSVALLLVRSVRLTRVAPSVVLPIVIAAHGFARRVDAFEQRTTIIAFVTAVFAHLAVCRFAERPAHVHSKFSPVEIPSEVLPTDATAIVTPSTWRFALPGAVAVLAIIIGAASIDRTIRRNPDLGSLSFGVFDGANVSATTVPPPSTTSTSTSTTTTTTTTSTTTTTTSTTTTSTTTPVSTSTLESGTTVVDETLADTTSLEDGSTDSLADDSGGDSARNWAAKVLLVITVLLVLLTGLLVAARRARRKPAVVATEPIAELSSSGSPAQRIERAWRRAQQLATRQSPALPFERADTEMQRVMQLELMNAPGVPEFRELAVLAQTARYGEDGALGDADAAAAEQLVGTFELLGGLRDNSSYDRDSSHNDDAARPAPR